MLGTYSQWIREPVNTTAIMRLLWNRRRHYNSRLAKQGAMIFLFPFCVLQKGDRVATLGVYNLEVFPRQLQPVKSDCSKRVSQTLYVGLLWNIPSSKPDHSRSWQTMGRFRVLIITEHYKVYIGETTEVFFIPVLRDSNSLGNLVKNSPWILVEHRHQFHGGTSHHETITHEHS